MSRKYKYTILVRFSNPGTNNVLLTRQIPYHNSHNSSYMDHVEIKERSIKLTMSRANRSELSSIFDNANTALVHQLTKCLAYYYCSVSNNALISSITVSRHINGRLQDRQTLKSNVISQVVTTSTDMSLLAQVNRSELETIFDENDKGRSLLYTVTHLIRALSSEEPFFSFENTWKSFNAIYKEKEQLQRDSDCLRNLRSHMLSNSHEYPLSISHVSGMTSEQIFVDVNWRRMVLNDFPTHTSQAGDFKGFVERQNDVRIIKKIRDTLTLRADHLQKDGSTFYTLVLNHISTIEAANSHVDIEVVAFLCLKYLYFQRNKIMHAERIDSSFHIVINDSNEERKIQNCKVVLLKLIIDLINFNSRF
ncbi:hypothetical protein [Vibrio parahaemolyticus]|uniref:hypothetical protein n=2 Tax=Vibrio parahaemolyticus TaxID=670 RepID=UPI0027E54053|nr:hypothetical protein [Vibrio parahaemolyticus]WMN75641.1 hypothetical protein NI386_15805 [Vibrio parahaemolyticus]